MAYQDPILVRIMYVFAIIFWTLIILYWRIDFSSLVSSLIIIIPYVLFAISFSSAGLCDQEVEGFLMRGNILTLGLVIAVPLLSWYASYYTGDKKKFISIASFAIVLSMMSLLDVWVSPKYLCAIMHLRSILQTIGVILLVYIMTEFIGHNNKTMSSSDSDISQSSKIQI